MTSPPAVSTPPGEEKIYRVGTLTYTQHQLYVLFFWLMWNDFTITLIEQVGSLTGFLCKDYGATNEELESLGRAIGRRRHCQKRHPWSAHWHAPGQLRCHGVGRMLAVTPSSKREG